MNNSWPFRIAIPPLSLFTSMFATTASGIAHWRQDFSGAKGDAELFRTGKRCVRLVAAAFGGFFLSGTLHAASPSAPQPTQPIPVLQQLPPPPALRAQDKLVPCGVTVDLAATAMNPTSITLTWPGLAGTYEVSSSGPGAPFRGSVMLGPAALAPRQSEYSIQSKLREPAAPPLFPGSLTHAQASPGSQYRYTIIGTLADGRKACGQAVAMTPPAPEKPARTRPVAPPGSLQVPLRGWVDLHTHPMINLAFGGKLIFGAPDSQSLLPANHSCAPWVPAGSVQEALGDDRPSHGGFDLVNFRCGDELRALVIGQMQAHNAGALVTAGPRRAPALGYPVFDTWPAWNDITHQKMWWEWIKRARDGGQRVMVALATNNRTLGDAVSGPGDGPTDDVSSADLQIDQIKLFVARHPDVMELALSPADLKRIVESNRIAVVLGVEIDNIGNLNRQPSPPDIQGRIADEIQRLYTKGVRYIFPVHVVNNIFGGTAIYTPMFNIANFRDTRDFWRVECSMTGDDIYGKYTGGFDPATLAAVKIGFDPRNQPPASPTCPQPGQPGQGVGHRNSMGLTQLGVFAIKEMMRRGMIIDIDHMSHHSVEQTLAIAEGINPPTGYPITSGHSGIRIGNSNRENSRSRAQLHRIAKLHGMFGLGTDGVHAYTWSRQYQAAMSYMGYLKDSAYRNGAIAFGTDLNGLVKGPPPGNAGTQNRVVYDAAWPMSEFPGTAKKWNYNTDGVAHYGMLPDFLLDVRTSPADTNLGRAPSGQPYGVTGADLVDNHLQRSADYFWHMWERCEAQKAHVR